MLPINNLNQIILEDEERLEAIRLENIERRLMRDQANCFEIDEVRFVELFRLTKDMAQYIFNAIIPDLIHGNNPVAVSPHTKFFGAMHFYATGSYQRMVGRSYNISVAQQTMSKILHEVTSVIIQRFGGRWIQFPVTLNEKNRIKATFMQMRNFPGVIGVIDCSHIEIIRPKEEEHAYLNRKGYHSINVQIVCDAELRILNINAQHAGATHDAHIWRNSRLRNVLNEFYNNGDRHSWLLGDSGYPLEPFLLTPVENAIPGTPEYRYTQSHMQARNCIERCIGVLKAEFLCLSKILRYSPQKVGNIINVCAILHNIRTEGRLNDNFEIPALPLARQENNMHIVHQNVGNQEGAQARRNLIQHYFL